MISQRPYIVRLLNKSYGYILYIHITYTVSMYMMSGANEQMSR